MTRHPVEGFFYFLMAALLIACVSQPRLQQTAPTTVVSGGLPTTDPAGGVPSVVLTGHTAPVTLLAWSPDGKLLASAARQEADHTIRLWDADGNLKQELKGHTADILSLAWSPNGATLASGAADQTVRFWKPDGSLARTQDINRGEVWALAWSPDGSILATGSMTGTLNPTVQLWKPDGSPIAAMGTQFTGGKFYNLLWSPDGTRLLGGAIDYKVWEADGSEVTHLKACQHCTPSFAAAWAADSQTFVIGDENGMLKIFDREGYLLEARQRYDNINAAAFSPDGKLLAAGRDIWRTDGTLLTGVNGRINSLAWSLDSLHLAAAAGGLVNIIDSDGNHLTVLRDHQGTVNVVAWSPKGSVLASGSDDATVRLWKVP